MVDQSAPSKDPANNGLLSGTFRQILKKFTQRELDDMLPAKIVAYDRSTNMATVEPMLRVVTTNNQLVTRAQIAEVPVLALGSSVCMINFNLQPGDVGWIKANDRDISVYLNNLAQVGPPTSRLHSFSDGLFIPDKVKDFNVVDADSAVTIQTPDGLHRFEVFSDKTKMTSGVSSVTVSPAGIAMVSPPGTLTHNGVNVGDTHSHNGSPTAPVGPISPTGVPV